MTETKPMGNKPINTLALDKKVRLLTERVVKLEQLIARMAHQTGTQNLLRYFDVQPFEPERKDMQKWG